MYVRLHVRLYVFVCMFVCMYACSSVCMYVHLHVRLYVFVRLYVCLYVCMFLCMYVCSSVCIYVCLSVLRLHTGRMYWPGSKEVKCLVWICLDEQFSGSNSGDQAISPFQTAAFWAGTALVLTNDHRICSIYLYYKKNSFNSHFHFPTRFHKILPFKINCTNYNYTSKGIKFNKDNSIQPK